MQQVFSIAEVNIEPTAKKITNVIWLYVARVINVHVDPGIPINVGIAIINHPPVITIFRAGGMVTIRSHGMVQSPVLTLMDWVGVPAFQPLGG